MNLRNLHSFSMDFDSMVATPDSIKTIISYCPDSIQHLCLTNLRATFERRSAPSVYKIAVNKTLRVQIDPVHLLRVSLPPRHHQHRTLNHHRRPHPHPQHNSNNNIPSNHNLIPLANPPKPPLSNLRMSHKQRSRRRHPLPTPPPHSKPGTAQNRHHPP